MLLVEKVSTVLGDRKEEVVMPPLLENKSLTKDVDKGTNELKYTKEAVVTIIRMDLDKFEGKYKVSTGWFKLDRDFFLLFYNSFRII